MGAHFMILYNSSRPEAQTPPVAAAPRPSLDDPIRDLSPPPRAAPRRPAPPRAAPRRGSGNRDGKQSAGDGGGRIWGINVKWRKRSENEEPVAAV